MILVFFSLPVFFAVFLIISLADAVTGGPSRMPRPRPPRPKFGFLFWAGVAFMVANVSVVLVVAEMMTSR